MTTPKHDQERRQVLLNRGEREELEVEGSSHAKFTNKSAYCEGNLHELS